jgi:hypothetical protein
MWFKFIIGLFFVSVVMTDFAFAQQIAVKTDSTRIYRNIENFSKKGKFTKFMYGLFFKPVATVSSKKNPKKKVYKKLIQKPYSAFEGKTIRNINIETLDPFGYTIADTIVANQNFLAKTGNSLHLKSQPITIRNLLLIRQNQPFDSLLAKESERLVRSQGYVHDVSFYVKTVSKNSDSVDVFIRELDNWSIIPKVESTASSFTINLLEKNFLGLGHEFRNIYTWNHTTGDDAFSTRYYIPNIRNTYINSTLLYGIDEYENFVKSFAVDRPFFSPFARWAAGVNFAQIFRNDSIMNRDSIYVPQRFKYNLQDYWAGHATRIFKGNTEFSRTTNLITTARFLRIRYLEQPSETIDTLHFYTNENFYLAGIGISTRKYVMDKYIFNFGLTEDVPIGKVYALTGGYQVKNDVGRVYLGARVSFGNYYEWGYLSSNFEYGTFFHAAQAEQGVAIAGLSYFTGLKEIGNWKFRQFVKLQFTGGLNRFATDSLTIKDGYGLDGFNSIGLTGTNRILFTLQTQSYAPWNFIGFRFGPYFICSLGMLGDATTGFSNSKVYSQIGLGVLIKNDYLVINTFQLSIAFYPTIPGLGSDIVKFNSFKTTDFGFKDFEIGKPAIVNFQ